MFLYVAYPEPASGSYSSLEMLGTGGLAFFRILITSPRS